LAAYEKFLGAEAGFGKETYTLPHDSEAWAEVWVGKPNSLER
jgi:hypothetical protein